MTSFACHSASLHVKIATSQMKLVKFLNEVKIELAKVVWPKRDEVVKLTLIVIIISVLIGAYIGALDFIFTKIVEYLVANI